MNRQPSDPTLSLIAAKFAKLTPFPDPDNVFKDEINAAPDWKNMHVYPNKTSVLAARFCFGGKMRVFGYAPFGRAADLARYCDLITLRFWKWKLRGAAPPTDADMNFSLATAEADVLTLPEAVGLIDEIENHLLKIGVFREARGPEVRAPEVRRTARGEFLACHKTLVGLLESYYGECYGQLTQLVTLLGDTAKRLAVLESRHNDHHGQMVLLVSTLDEMAKRLGRLESPSAVAVPRSESGLL